MPEITLTGWKHRIRAYCDANAIDKSDSQVSRMALKISKRMTSMNSVTDWERALRILGLATDTTPRDALLPRMEPTRHISTRRPHEALTKESAA